MKKEEIYEKLEQIQCDLKEAEDIIYSIDDMLEDLLDKLDETIKK